MTEMPVQVAPVEHGVFHVAAHALVEQSAHVRVGGADEHSAQIRAHQLRPAESRAADLRTLQIDARKFGAVEIGAAKVGILKVDAD